MNFYIVLVRYSSVSLSPTFGRNEKVEQHTRKKTRKPNALRFWVEGGVISLYVGSVLILVRSHWFSPSDSPHSILFNNYYFYYLIHV